ncbi:hypothetical protein [Actinoplanes friuliensis]|nr:hypothetical protein [Actinoplanes friuliensis]
MIANAYLMTRGTPRRNDYAFLGAVPPSRWWDRVNPYVFMESPEVVVARHPGGVGVLISGLPSARRDVIGTAIRHTVVIDDLRDQPELLCRIVAAGLDPRTRTALGEHLDEEFDAGRVDAIMDGGDAGTDVPQRVAEILATVSADVPGPGRDPEGSWVGGADDEGSRRAFLARVRRLAAEEASGFAFTSQAIATARGAGEAAGRLGAPVAILLVDGDVDGVQPLGKDRPLPPERRSPALLMTGLALTGVAVAVILWWIARRVL